MADKPKDHPDFKDTLREGGEEAVRARILNFEEAKSRKNTNGEGSSAEQKTASEQQKKQEKAEQEKQVDVLVKLAQQKASLLFHSSDGITWADLRIAEHRETWPIRSRGFKRWLIFVYAQEKASIPNSDTIARAIDCSMLWRLCKVMSGKSVYVSPASPAKSILTFATTDGVPSGLPPTVGASSLIRRFASAAHLRLRRCQCRCTVATLICYASI